jgi:hypothetical protein
MEKIINIKIFYLKKWMAVIEETNERLASGATKNEAITKAMFSFERESNCKLLIKNDSGKIIKTRCRRSLATVKSWQ